MARRELSSCSVSRVFRTFGVFGAAMAPLIAVSDVGADGRVQWLENFQRQASQLQESQFHMGATPLGDGAQASGGTAQVATSDDTAGVKTFELPLAGRERSADGAADPFATADGGELIVTDLSLADLEIAKLRGFVASAPTVLRPGQEVTRLRLPGATREAAAQALRTILPSVSAMPNEIYTIVPEPDDEIGADARTVIERSRKGPAVPGPCPAEACFGADLIAWRAALGTCARDVRVGIIDTSFDLTHPALQHITSEQGVFLGGQAPSPSDWHGTAVLSVLAGDPSSGTPGLMPEATFLLAAAFLSDADGNATTDTVRVLAALAWLDAQGVDIVNMSFSGPEDAAVAQAISGMRKKGVLFVAAAGNMGPVAAPSYPAAYPDVIAVTAVNRNGEGYRHANRGDYIDVSAPGVDILIALPRAQQGVRSGTSFSAPFVTAIAAARAGGRLPYNAAVEGAGVALLGDLAVRDLGPPGRDPIYGAGLALAPAACVSGGEPVAKLPPASTPMLDARVLEAGTRAPLTVIRAGAAGGLN